MEPFQLREGASVPYFSLEPWEREFPHVLAGMSARDEAAIQDPHRCNFALHVGDDPQRVVQNREQLSVELGVPFTGWTCGNQVHGVAIREVLAEDRGRGRASMDDAYPDTDGLLTLEEDVLLASFYADCVPLLFYSPRADAVGVAHAGWRGTVGGIGRRMVKELVRRGGRPEEIRAAIAPSIGGCCYEVDEKVVLPLQEALPGVSEPVLRKSGPGKWKLDLREANRRLLLAEGLREEHILMTGWCTSCHPEWFHSHRRDRGYTGRMVAFIAKRKGSSNNGR